MQVAVTNRLAATRVHLGRQVRCSRILGGQSGQLAEAGKPGCVLEGSIGRQPGLQLTECAGRCLEPLNPQLVQPAQSQRTWI